MSVISFWLYYFVRTNFFFHCCIVCTCTSCSFLSIYTYLTCSIFVSKHQQMSVYYKHIHYNHVSTVLSVLVTGVCIKFLIVTCIWIFFSQYPPFDDPSPRVHHYANWSREEEEYVWDQWENTGWHIELLHGCFTASIQVGLYLHERFNILIYWWFYVFSYNVINITLVFAFFLAYITILHNLCLFSKI